MVALDGYADGILIVFLCALRPLLSRLFSGGLDVGFHCAGRPPVTIVVSALLLVIPSLFLCLREGETLAPDVPLKLAFLRRQRDE